MNKMELIATLNANTKACASISCKVKSSNVMKDLIPLYYYAFLKAMRDANTKEFHKAMALFADEAIDDLENLFGGEDND